MAEILPGIHQIPIVYKGRPLKLYLIVAAEACVLMDVGDAEIPAREIRPYLQQAGIADHRITHILLTHPDTDHTQGLPAAAQLWPEALRICGTADKADVESSLHSTAVRYGARFRSFETHTPGPISLPAEQQPDYVPIHLTCTGGETLRLGPGQDIEILHLPGHSRGHLGVYLPWLDTAIVGDAVHGLSNNYMDGTPAFACTYMYITDYLNTIALLQKRAPRRLLSCHWPDCLDHAAVQAFLADSRAYALAAEASILNTLREHPTGLTLAELIPASKPRLGTWPSAYDSYSKSMLTGHLEHLMNLGQVRGADEPLRFSAV